jgi:hypothetical protein
MNWRLFLSEFYGIRSDKIIAEAYGTRLAYHTSLIEQDGHKLILQKINKVIFKQPELIDKNIKFTGWHLEQYFSEIFVNYSLADNNGNTLVKYENEVSGIFQFAEGTKVFDIVPNADIAFEAVQIFDGFTSNLSGFNADLPSSTITDFQNISFRFVQFTGGLKTAKECNYNNLKMNLRF